MLSVEQRDPESVGVERERSRNLKALARVDLFSCSHLLRSLPVAGLDAAPSVSFLFPLIAFSCVTAYALCPEGSEMKVNELECDTVLMDMAEMLWEGHMRPPPPESNVPGLDKGCLATGFGVRA